MVALHGTDPATVHLSVWARIGPRPLSQVAAELRAALEERRSLLRILSMRRTLHLLEPELAGAACALAAARLTGPHRKLASDLLAKADLVGEHGPEPVLDRLRDAVLEALADGDRSTDQLREAVPDLDREVTFFEDKAYGGKSALARYLLQLFDAEGHVLRARALGGWRVQGTTWARADRWFPARRTPPVERATAALARAWLEALGPGTPEDLAWWAGIGKRDAARALEALGEDVVRVRVEGQANEQVAARSLVADLDAAAPHPVALLPALDPLLMGHKDRSWAMDPAWAPTLFDRSGNSSPTIWSGGRVVGAWAVRRDGSVATGLLVDDVDRDEVDAAARELERCLGGEVVQPRFPTPLSRSLAAS